MAKFCGKCGARLDTDTGLCPNCHADKLNKRIKKPEWVEPPKHKRGTVPESAKTLSKKEAKKQHKADKKAAKKAKKKEKWASMTFEQKARKSFIKFIAIAFCLVALLCIFFGILVYFDIVDMAVISTVLDKIGIKDIPKPGIGLIQIGGKFTSINVVDSDSAIAAAQEVAKNCGLENAANELSVANINTVDGITYYRLQQNYNGIPVYGRTFIISADDSGNTQSLTSNSIDIDVDTCKTIPLEEAKTIIKNYLNNTLKSSNDNTTVFNSYSEIIYTFSDISPVFAYRFKAVVEDELYDVFLGVEEKSVIACFDANMTQTVSGTGIDVNGNNTSFNVNKKSDALFTLEDFDRNIRVFDANNRTVFISNDCCIVDSSGNIYKLKEENFIDKNNNIVIVDNDNGRIQQGKWKVIDVNGNVLGENAYFLVDIYGKDTKLNPVESNSATFTNNKTVTLMKEAQNIYDFFLEKFSRMGFDNNNGSMSLVANNTRGAYSSDIAQGTPAAILVLGSDNELTTELIAHEYMHSVERSISGMLYEGESGAIMEAYSDLFGEILEDYYNDGTLNGNCDWIHHAKEELGYDHSRNIENPNESDNPSKVGEETRPFWLRLVIAKDDVHHCSTIISHAAYIMTTTQGGSTPLTMDELMNLWYRTLLTLPSNCTFSDLRESMIVTATNIGFPKEKVDRVSSAFSMVGIESNKYSGEYSTDIQISVFDNEGKKYGEYSIDISGQKKLYLWFTEDYNASYDGSAEPVSIHLDKGDYLVTVADKNNETNSYSKSITVSKDTTGKDLRFATDFGNIQYESQKKGKFEPSDILVDAVEFNGHYYYVYNLDTVTTWEEAKEYCESQGGYLATITSPEEQAFISDLVQNQEKRSYWIGLTDEEELGNWEWVNGETFSYSNWGQNEPNHGYGGTEHYVAIVSYDTKYDYPIFLGEWNDHTNDKDIEQFGFICEWGEYSVEPNSQSKEPVRTTSDERDIVLVLDSSGSMSGTPMEETKKAATNFVNTILEEDASIGIVTYDNSASTVSDFSVNKTMLTEVISSIWDGGGTNIEAGLAKAHSMLNTSGAKKKIIVLMSDGEPNDGKEGDALISYADEIKNDGIIIYTLGFFENMHGNKSSAQYLMEHLASDGCHYEVASADDLVFFFEDMADQINGQKYIYIRIACPVDVTVTYNGETLCSAEDKLNVRTDFGTLTFEDSENERAANEEDRIKVLRLKEGVDYDVQIVGTGRGMMDYTIGFMDESGEYSDFRRFEDVKITKKTVIDTVAAVSSESVLNIDEDGDGKYDLKLRAEENGYGEEIKHVAWLYYAIGGTILIILLLIYIKIITHKKKRGTVA